MTSPRKACELVCPKHGAKLVHSHTKFGARWSCPVESCTVACWGGSTSTPADDHTRTLRNACHKVFDPLWRDAADGPFAVSRRSGKVEGGNHRRKHRAYSWLAERMQVPFEKAHFGMFDAAQCEKALAEIQALIHDHQQELTQ